MWRRAGVGAPSVGGEIKAPLGYDEIIALVTLLWQLHLTLVNILAELTMNTAPERRTNYVYK